MKNGRRSGSDGNVGEDLHEGEGLMVAATRARRVAFPYRCIGSAVVAALLAQSVGVGPALAQDEPSSAETAAARTLAVEGLKLAEAGRCADAIEKLARAEKLHHSAIVQGQAGRVPDQLGKARRRDGEPAQGAARTPAGQLLRPLC